MYYLSGGNSGLLPMMFPGTFEYEFDEKEKYRLEHDENGNIQTVLIYKQPITFGQIAE